MPNYNETEIVGSQYQRARLLQISNEEDTIPSITYLEESVIVLGDKKIRGDNRQLTKVYSPGTNIPLRDPETDELTGEVVTHEFLYQILYSEYRNTAEEADRAVTQNNSSPETIPENVSEPVSLPIE